MFKCVSVKNKPGGVKSKPGAAELFPPQTEVSVQNLGSPSCDAERCSNHGRCVTVTGELVCECEEGYSGDLCQNNGSSRTALALILTFLFGGALLAAVIIKKRFFHFFIFTISYVYKLHTCTSLLPNISAEGHRQLG